MAGAQRAWLDVPYAQRDDAKALGARWDARERRWFDPRPGSSSGLGRWAARPPVPELLPDEDHSFGSGLFVDLVPSACWFTNVRSCVDPTEWERLRRMILGRAAHRCEACGRGEDRPSQRWLEAHERWAYDEAAEVQALRRLICLCTDCHRATHYGLAQVHGLEGEAFAHLRAVTGMSPGEARAHVDEAFALWQSRSARTWTLDLSILTDAGIALAPPPGAQQRPAATEDALRTVREAESIPPRPPELTPPGAAGSPPGAGADRAQVPAAPHADGVDALVAGVERAVRDGMDELLRTRGLVCPPAVHLFQDFPRPAYLGSVGSRRFYRGEDAATSVFLLGELPSALRASRLLVTWEAQDLSVALEEPLLPELTALVVVDAAPASTVLRWHALSLAEDRGGGVGLVPLWGAVEAMADPILPEPIAELLERWRIGPARELGETVRGLELMGYRLDWHLTA